MSDTASTVTVSPPPSNPNAALNANPVVFIDIYTPEGGQFTFSSSTASAAVLSVQVMNSINRLGTFRIVLAPQFLPNSANLSWSQIITPMSTVIIGMKRGISHNIVMVGLVSEVQETQSWGEGRGVQRQIVISGTDFEKYFDTPDYYSLFFLASTAAGSQNNVAGALSDGLITGDPGQVAENWFENIMLNNGVLENTSVPFGGAKVQLANCIGSSFDRYDTQIPFGYYFIGMNERWSDKFREILQSPFYEFFITTAGFSGNFINPFGVEGFFDFTCKGLQGDDASPIVIGRKTPFPMLTGTVGENNAPSFGSVDSSLWNALSSYTPDISPSSFLSSTVNFSDSVVYNFYIINPYYATGQIGGSNQNFLPPVYQMGGAYDPASIARYGFRPQILGTHWMADTTGSITASGFTQESMWQLAATLLARLASVYEPLPLMAEAEVSIFLRPDIQIGQRFVYAPFRDLQSWTFYIESVTHNFNFGGRSSTTLNLSRGLPTDVYGNSGLLQNILTGNAQRLNGKYVSGLPEQFNGISALKGLSVADLAKWTETLQQFYTSAQFSGPVPPP